jgi:hypothetical protein
MSCSKFHMLANEETGELPLCLSVREFRETYPELVQEFEGRVLMFEMSDPYRPKSAPGNPGQGIKHIEFGMGTCPTAATTTLELSELCCWLTNAEIMKDKNGDLAANIPCANFPGFLIFWPLASK